MSQSVLAVAAETDPITALGLMRRGGVRHLPVVRGRHCIGLLTETDLLNALIALPPNGLLSVGRLCRVPAPTVTAGSAPATIAAVILAGGADAALVVRDGVLVGIVTTTDVLARVAGSWDPTGTGQNGGRS